MTREEAILCVEKKIKVRRLNSSNGQIKEGDTFIPDKFQEDNQEPVMWYPGFLTKDENFHHLNNVEMVMDNVFPAWTHVVLLHGPDHNPNPWLEMPINHCYLLREASYSNHFLIDKDCRGLNYGWVSSSYDNQFLLRKATYKEAKHYKEIDKPFHVDILKDKEKQILLDIIEDHLVY